MDKLTKKEEVMQQLANLACGIERVTGDSVKAKALREAISMIDVAPKTNAEKRYNMHGCGSANKRIAQLEKENAEQRKVIEHIHRAVGHKDDSPMCCWESVDAVTSEAEQLREENDKLKSDYGDNWYDGFMAAKEWQLNEHSCCITDLEEIEIRNMSEDAEQLKAKNKEQHHE